MFSYLFALFLNFGFEIMITFIYSIEINDSENKFKRHQITIKIYLSNQVVLTSLDGKLGGVIVLFRIFKLRGRSSRAKIQRVFLVYAPPWPSLINIKIILQFYEDISLTHELNFKLTAPGYLLIS